MGKAKRQGSEMLSVSDPRRKRTGQRSGKEIQASATVRQTMLRNDITNY
jgi:hypothetical protein